MLCLNQSGKKQSHNPASVSEKDSLYWTFKIHLVFTVSAESLGK